MNHFTETNKLLKNSSFFYTIAIGMDSNYMYVSDNYDKNFDFVKDSLLGKQFSVTLHPDDIRICAEVGMKCFQNPGRLFPATLRKHDGKGGFVITQWEMQAMFDDQNQPLGIYCIGYNITDYVQSRFELANAQTEIETQNNKLTEIGLLQSHVIRKPLANIMGLANILSTMEMDANVQSIIQMLMDSAKGLDSVIQDISNMI
ncbi:hypothetical protein [Mucilaginibacter sp.]